MYFWFAYGKRHRVYDINIVGVGSELRRFNVYKLLFEHVCMISSFFLGIAMKDIEFLKINKIT